MNFYGSADVSSGRVHSD